MEQKIYHVTTKPWDGRDLLCTRTRIDKDLVTDEEAIEEYNRKFGSCYDVDTLPSEIGCLEWLYVHCHETLEEAIDFLSDYCADDGQVLEIDTECLDVEVGAEYPHPVVLGRITADYIKVVGA